MQNLNSHIQKVVCIANRLSIAPRSLRSGVEAELVEAAKELVAAEDGSNKPVNTAELESAIATQQHLAQREKDPLKLASIVGQIRDLKNQLTS
jgi:hypothetical protein